MASFTLRFIGTFGRACSLGSAVPVPESVGEAVCKMLADAGGVKFAIVVVVGSDAVAGVATVAVGVSCAAVEDVTAVASTVGVVVYVMIAVVGAAGTACEGGIASDDGVALVAVGCAVGAAALLLFMVALAVSKESGRMIGWKQNARGEKRGQLSNLWFSRLTESILSLFSLAPVLPPKVERTSVKRRDGCDEVLEVFSGTCVEVQPRARNRGPGAKGQRPASRDQGLLRPESNDREARGRGWRPRAKVGRGPRAKGAKGQGDGYSLATVVRQYR
jgi:hypothetical protein